VAWSVDLICHLRLRLWHTESRTGNKISPESLDRSLNALVFSQLIHEEGCGAGISLAIDLL
jgi:hypothetical protein